MKNYILNTLGYQARVRMLFAECSELIADLRAAYQLEQPLLEGFTELIATLCLMTGPMDSNERIYLKLLGDTSQRYMTGSAEGTGSVRGFVGEHFQIDVMQPFLFGKNGTIMVSKDSGSGAGYTGIIGMSEQSISQNLAHYYNQSEQLPTFISLFATKDITRGIMVQLLPGESSALLDQVRSAVIEHEAGFLNPQWELNFENLQGIISDLKFMAIKPLHMQCSCTKEQYYGLLFTLSAEEVQLILAQEETLYATCCRCGKQYAFTAEEIAKLHGILD